MWCLVWGGGGLLLYSVSRVYSILSRVYSIIQYIVCVTGAGWLLHRLWCAGARGLSGTWFVRFVWIYINCGKLPHLKNPAAPSPSEQNIIHPVLSIIIGNMSLSWRAVNITKYEPFNGNYNNAMPSYCNSEMKVKVNILINYILDRQSLKRLKAKVTILRIDSISISICQNVVSRWI